MRLPIALAGVAILLLAATSAGAGDARRAAPPVNVDWPFYGNDPGNTRFQPLDQIAPSNVSRLRVAWVFHTKVLDSEASLEVSPIEVGGRVFVTSGHDDVFALDARTGRRLWAYHPERSMPPLSKISACCGLDNRGVAYSGGLVYVARLDGVLVALDATDGHVAWQARVADWRQGYSMTIAPQIAAGRVIVGVSGGEFLIRGAVSAYDARTGRLAWRYETTSPGTWSGTSWRNGGAPVWGNPSVDPRLGLVYVTTGNAAPDFNGSTRSGKNLYASSILALDVRDGRLRWAFQEVHHDLWDYDGPQPPVLFTLERGGRSVPALGHCNKDGNYFVLDRRTGKPLWPVSEQPVATTPAWQHPWPTQPVSSVEPLTPLRVSSDPPKGVRIAPEFTPPAKQPLLIQPGAQAGCEWEPAAYSPRTGDVYYGARYQPTIYVASPSNTRKNDEGETLGSKETTPVPGVTYYGLFGATSMTTGKVVWKIRVPQLAASGVVVAGDLAFFGQQNGSFEAVDAATGKRLWSFRGTSIFHGGGATAGPIAYAAAGREYVVDAFGGNSDDRTSRKQRSPLGDAIVAFALPGR